jgi:hypothetical protein
MTYSLLINEENSINWQTDNFFISLKKFLAKHEDLPIPGPPNLKKFHKRIKWHAIRLPLPPVSDTNFR